MKLSPGPDGKKEAHKIFRALTDMRQLLGKYDMLADPLEAALKALCDQMTDILCEYPISQLDQRLKELDAKFPDFEHGYIRSGMCITWIDRPRSPDNTFYREFGPYVRTLARAEKQEEEDASG